MPRLLFLAITLLWPAAAAAQSTQPAESAWPKTVDALAKALAQGDAVSLKPLLAEDAAIRAFDNRPEGLSRLLSRVRKARLVGAHGYLGTPVAMAADIAADFKNSTIAPDDVKRRMVPENDAEMSRANATAAQWLNAALGAKPNTPVGVIVLWCPKTDAGPDETDPEMHVVFVLVRGEEAARNKYRIKQVAHGDPLAEAR